MFGQLLANKNKIATAFHRAAPIRALVWGASRSDPNASSACLQRCVHGLFLCAAAAMSSSVLCGQTAKHILGEAKHASHIAFAHDSVMQLVGPPCPCPALGQDHTHANPKYFLLHPSHQIFKRMHEALNVGKKNN
jgi:hypothetical protein